MTILSTDLRSLKRRGYNGKNLRFISASKIADFNAVDRILKQQKAERQAAEDARAANDNHSLISKPLQQASQGQLPPPISNDTLPQVTTDNLSEQPTSPTFPGSFDSQRNAGHSDSKGAGNLIQSWKRKITGMGDTNRPQSGISLHGGPVGETDGGASNAPTVTPQSNICTRCSFSLWI